MLCPSKSSRYVNDIKTTAIIGRVSAKDINYQKWVEPYYIDPSYSEKLVCTVRRQPGYSVNCSLSTFLQLLLFYHLLCAETGAYILADV